MRRILCLAQHTSTRNVSPRLVSLRSYATTTKYGQPVHETHPHILQPGEREIDHPYNFSLHMLTESSDSRNHCS